ncbi:hypothetical protein N7468_008061 [Penicillium chermesinum]|uniref:Major facilitator superfamily (MFS) profile domain-containing protein n=1 Tax=Penicillium chermesinum TaxID=63820 RepID=A0A9W9TIB0_9EURO|nr:uncharacterized protein N7468_008061 [Penicillium chermesinum]KAJ5223519.1 hypothetical protein N7468_008061 [Penicillium chermesinum]
MRSFDESFEADDTVSLKRCPKNPTIPNVSLTDLHKTPGSTAAMLRLSIWIAFAAWIANFDNGYTGTVIIMPSYKKAFGSCSNLMEPKTGLVVEQCFLTALQQSMISLNYLFIGIGGGLSGVTGRFFGRRGSIQIGCVLAIIGAAGMLGTGGRGAGSFVHYMVCRCISAAGIGLLVASAVTYGAECIVAQKRGFSLGVYNLGLALGNVASSAVCAGSARLEPGNNWQWKTPILCQIPLGFILGTGILMFPESPRWILGNNPNKEGEARKAFAALYHMDPYSPAITAQIENVKAHIKTEQATLRSTSWYQIYHKSQLRRTLASALIMVGLSITGIQFVQPYATTFLRGVGLSDPYLVNVIIGVCILGGLMPWALDFCMLILSSVSTALGQDETSKIVIVVLLGIWAFIFGGTIAPTAGLASVEMHSVSLRTYGQANTTIFYGIFSFGATFWTPYMLDADHGNMGPNVGYFYAGVTVVIAVLIFFLVPETGCLTLEQIDELWSSRIKPWQTSMTGNRQMVRSRSQELQE